MSVDKIVGSIKLSFEEPSNISMLKSTRRDGFEVAIPCEKFTGEITEELIRV